VYGVRNVAPISRILSAPRPAAATEPARVNGTFTLGFARGDPLPGYEQLYQALDTLLVAIILLTVLAWIWFPMTMVICAAISVFAMGVCVVFSCATTQKETSAIAEPYLGAFENNVRDGRAMIDNSAP
jgi:hypothetical protein